MGSSRFSLNTEDLSREVNIVASRVYFRNVPFIVILLYMSPSCSVKDYERVFELIENCDILNSNIVVLGDFNIPNFVHGRGDRKCELACGFMNVLSLGQFNFVTNSYHRCLDLVFCNFNCNVDRDECPMMGEDRHHPSLQVDIGPAHVKHEKLPVNLNDHVDCTN